jgi:hypothetical protein
MVDKRNGGANQNDAGYDSNQFLESGSNPNTLNSFKLGASLNSIVNDSDKEWAKRKIEQNNEQIDVCKAIMDDKKVRDEHEKNFIELYGVDANSDGIPDGGLYNKLKNEDQYTITEIVEENGKKVEKQVVYTEAQLMDKVNEFKKLDDEFEYFKREIVEWANDILS